MRFIVPVCGKSQIISLREILALISLKERFFALLLCSLQ